MGRLFTLCLFVLLIPGLSHSQRLVEIINQAERSALTVKSFTPSGTLLSEGCGFTISPDGLAIVPAHLFYNSDSLLVETRNGRKLGIHRLIQTHPFANLALVKLSGKTREFDYFIPSKSPFRESQEILIFGHPSEAEEGITLGSIYKVLYQVFLNREGTTKNVLSKKSFGAPVINNRGELVGIVNAYDPALLPVVLGTAVLNDTNWVTVNIPLKQIPLNPDLRIQLRSDINEGLFDMTNGKFEQAAASFSNYQKINKNNAVVYALRGHARYLYKNTYGSKEDLSIARKIEPGCFLPFYFEGLHLIDENKTDEAITHFSLCLERKPGFAFALVERGRLLYNAKRDFEAAYLDFLSATRIDTLYGAGYYEKGRFILQHFEDKNPAYQDIDKAIVLDPDLPGVFSIRGTMRINDQNYLSAIQDFDIALAKDPNDLSALFNRGVALFNLGMKEKACKDWDKAGSLGHYKSIKYTSRYCTGSSRKY